MEGGQRGVGGQDKGKKWNTNCCVSDFRVFILFTFYQKCMFFSVKKSPKLFYEEVVIIKHLLCHLHQKYYTMSTSCEISLYDDQ